MFNIFIEIIPAISERPVTIHIGITIELGLLEPYIALKAIILLGISCKDAVFKSTNVVILLLGISFLLLSSCNDFIAFMPFTVAAFPTPIIFF